MKNCIINHILNEAQRSEGSNKKAKYGFFLPELPLRHMLRITTLFVIIFSTNIFSQDITLDYIFQDTNIVNPRPSLKYINPASKKIYYYADDDYDGMLSLFDMDYKSGDNYKYSDSGESASEFVIMPNGNAVTIVKGDVYITKDFVNSRDYTKDIRLTETDKYEYSPEVVGNYAIYRRGGNYFIRKFDSLKAVSNELPLTEDESDSLSYQIIDITDKFKGDQKTELRLFVVKYNNSSKLPLVFPDYNGKFVKAETKKRGISKVNMYEYIINSSGKDSIYKTETEFSYPGTERYSTSFGEYSPDGKKLLLDIETLDRHSRKLFMYDVVSKDMREIYSESDPAWFERHSNQTMFIDSEYVMFESEISGYNNLYKIKTDGSGLTAVAGGPFTILSSVVNRQKGIVYFVANTEVPYDYNIYSADLSSGSVIQLTKEHGDIEDLRISSDGNYLFYSHSFINKPNELYSYNLPTGETKQLTSTISPKFSAIEWKMPEVITFNNEEDGQLLYGFVYKPKNFNPKKKYPLICFVHGAGYLQNVTNGFSPYRDNFMVDTYLTEKDFIILDIDYRGSMGYGKEFRNKTYRNLGYWEVSDYISGVNHLDNLGFIDKNNVGMYGGSYGGFTTLMALFRHPEMFKAGVSLRAVSDWKNYFYSNRWFTLGRLGDLDSSDIAGYYELSSPITYAENLQGHLLMTHGMLDDNVFFQDMVQLTQKLIDNKKDFEVMIYPKENHGFYRQTSWLDQYKRITGWFEKYLK
ncbi:MAG: prolyl oligopeptidase family serine peptidase [Ignavibacteria bacterium]